MLSSTRNLENDESGKPKVVPLCTPSNKAANQRSKIPPCTGTFRFWNNRPYGRTFAAPLPGPIGQPPAVPAVLPLTFDPRLLKLCAAYVPPCTLERLFAVYGSSSDRPPGTMRSQGPPPTCRPLYPPHSHVTGPAPDQGFGLQPHAAGPLHGLHLKVRQVQALVAVMQPSVKTPPGAAPMTGVQQASVPVSKSPLQMLTHVPAGIAVSVIVNERVNDKTGVLVIVLVGLTVDVPETVDEDVAVAVTEPEGVDEAVWVSVPETVAVPLTVAVRQGVALTLDVALTVAVPLSVGVNETEDVREAIAVLVGVSVTVGVAVRLNVELSLHVSLTVPVSDGDSVPVALEVGVIVAVPLGADVPVRVAETAGVSVALAVRVFVGAGVAVRLAVELMLGVALAVAVSVSVAESVSVAVPVGVRVPVPVILAVAVSVSVGVRV